MKEQWSNLCMTLFWFSYLTSENILIPLGDSGVQHLVSALPTLPSLAILDLKSNGITHKGLASVASALTSRDSTISATQQVWRSLFTWQQSTRNFILYVMHQATTTHFFKTTRQNIVATWKCFLYKMQFVQKGCGTILAEHLGYWKLHVLLLEKNLKESFQDYYFKDLP